MLLSALLYVVLFVSAGLLIAVGLRRRGAEDELLRTRARYDIAAGVLLVLIGIAYAVGLS